MSDPIVLTSDQALVMGVAKEMAPQAIDAVVVVQSAIALKSAISMYGAGRALGALASLGLLSPASEGGHSLTTYRLR